MTCGNFKIRNSNWPVQTLFSVAQIQDNVRDKFHTSSQLNLPNCVSTGGCDTNALLRFVSTPWLWLGRLAALVGRLFSSSTTGLACLTFSVSSNTLNVAEP